MHDAVVVGAGPAGTVTASLLAKDHDVVVIEEHAASGHPQQCAGLVTKSVLDMLDVRPEILSEINGANVIFPNGKEFELRADRTMAVLIDRADLDRKMAERAVDAGAEIRYGVKYREHLNSEDQVSIRTDNEELRSRMIIGADGHTSSVSLSLKNNGPKEYIYGIQVDVKKRSEHSDTMNLRVGSEFAPGFFSWEIPFDDKVRMGLCIKEGTGTTPNDHLKKLLRINNVEESDIVTKYSGKIPIGGRPRSYGDRMMLIGDAAGQVKPISGGGLYPILRSAPVLKVVATDALNADRLLSEDLSKYEKGWKREIGKELSKGYKIRKMFLKLNDNDLNKVSEIIDRDDTKQILKNIDLDHPSNTAWPILKHPGVGLRFLPIILKAIL